MPVVVQLGSEFTLFHVNTFNFALCKNGHINKSNLWYLSSVTNTRFEFFKELSIDFLNRLHKSQWSGNNFMDVMFKLKDAAGS